MESRHHAILLTRTGERWRWALIDAGGETVLEGTASTQERAMEGAWGLAAELDEDRPRVWPEIFVGKALKPRIGAERGDIR